MIWGFFTVYFSINLTVQMLPKSSHLIDFKLWPEIWPRSRRWLRLNPPPSKQWVHTWSKMIPSGSILGSGGSRRVQNKSRMGPRLIHGPWRVRKGFLRFESSPILSFYTFYISCPVNTCRWTIVQINHCKIVHEIHHFFEARFLCFYWFYVTW